MRQSLTTWWARGARRLGPIGLACATVITMGGCGAHHDAATGIGSLPGFLPKNASQLGHRVVDASVTAPALASNGDTVRVHVGSATTLVSVTGPAVPNEGLLDEPDKTPATWIVTLRDASATIPLRLDDFTVKTQMGEVVDPHVAPGSSMPKEVVPGRPESFAVQAVLEPGEGLIRWSPGGGHAPVEWDFTVEDD